MREIHILVLGKARCRVVKSEASDDPLGRYSNVIAEKPLQRPLAHSYLGGQLIHAIDSPICLDSFNNPAHDASRLVRRRYARPQDRLSRLHHPRITLST